MNRNALVYQESTAVVYWGVYAGICRIPTSGFFWQRILTSAIINKQGTFRPFATPVCVYPLPFLAMHHWSTVITCAKNRTCNPRSSNVQARVTSCVRQPATAWKWRAFQLCHGTCGSWCEPVVSVPWTKMCDLDAHWCHLANTIAYISWGPDVVME